MASTYVLDAGEMIAFLRQEQGWVRAADALAEPGSTCYAHAANLAEVFYDVRRTSGEDEAQKQIAVLDRAGVTGREDLDSPFWQDAARIKADYRRVSLSDCFGLALARRVGCPFVTTDHHELDALHAAGVCPVQFIR